jgi:chemotaxis family two-component system response regulator Rcp1
VQKLRVATDGQQALEYVAEMGKRVPCPDLMLLDINLPKVDGAAVLSAFRKLAQCIRTPVIIVTSSDAWRDRVQLSALGVNAYFCKPFELEAYMRLGGIVQAVMGQKAA